MNLRRKLALAFMPRDQRDFVEAELRLWMVRCACGFCRAVWDIGGVKADSPGESRCTLRCPQCLVLGPHTITREPDEPYPTLSQAETVTRQDAELAVAVNQEIVALFAGVRVENQATLIEVNRQLQQVTRAAADGLKAMEGCDGPEKDSEQRGEEPH